MKRVSGRTLRSQLLCTASAMAALLAPASALAETEELVVTATKREQALVDLAASVSALGGDDLELRGVGTVEDLQFQVPNLVYGETQGTSQITIRGVGLSVETGFAEQGVASHVDGVFLARPGMTNIVGGDIERVEVLRGPQGTLYGRNSTGGIINYITRKPTEEFEAGLTAGYAEFDTYNVEGVLSGPISERLLGRLFVSFSDTSGYIDEPSGPEVGDEQALSARGSATIKAEGGLDIDLSAFLLSREGGFNYNQTTNWFGPAPVAVAQIGPNEFTSSVDPEAEHEVYGGIATLNWANDDVAFKSITSYVTEERDEFYDSDGTTLDVTNVDRFDTTDTYSQEFNLSGTFAKNLDWIVGAYLFAEDADLDLDVIFGADTGPLAGLGVLQSQSEDNLTYAFFTDLTLSVTDRLRLVGGLRYSRDEKEITLNNDNQVAAVTCSGVVEIESDSLNPKAAIEFDWSQETMLYAQYQKGTKPGGVTFGDLTCGAVTGKFKEEQIQSFEGGIKTSFAGGRASLFVTGFHYDYDDYQVFQIIFPSSVVNNAPKASVNGAEVELNALLLDNIRLNVGAAWLDAQFDEFTDTDSFGILGLVPGVPATPQDLSGNKLTRAPEYTLSAGLEGTWALFANPLFADITLRGEVFHTDEMFFRQFNEEFDKQDAYTVLNAFLVLTSVNDQVQLRLYGKNLGDEEYIVSQFSNPSPLGNAATMGLYGRPLTWGVSLSAKF